eukprot:617963-Pleurochrysis_carterae.AAC.1
MQAMCARPPKDVGTSVRRGAQAAQAGAPPPAVPDPASVPARNRAPAPARASPPGTSPPAPARASPPAPARASPPAPARAPAPAPQPAAGKRKRKAHDDEEAGEAKQQMPSQQKSKANILHPLLGLAYQKSGLAARRALSR